MRAMLVTAIFLAGCLHARGPVNSAAKADPAALHAFDLLVNDADTIDDAAAFAEAKGLPREDVLVLAERAYWSFMRAGVYVPAAEIASRFRFKPRAVDLALEAARRDYEHAAAAYIRGKGMEGELTRLHAAQWELTLEIRIACRYATPKEARETVSRATALKTTADEMSVLYPLLDEGCPVDDGLRNSIIDHALYDGKYDFAIRHGAAAGWDDVREGQFLWYFFYYGHCTYGVRALVDFKVPPASSKNFIEKSNCEGEIVDSTRWKLDPKDADDWFFAAVRGKKYNLALVLLPLGTHGENGQVFLFQETVRVSGEPLLVQAMKMHSDFHDAFMAYLWERGRFRFIANYALTYDWQRKAFDKLIELKRWEDAAEAAQYGSGEALKTEGILIAFRAAMAAGDFKSGRYFVARYGPVKDKSGLVTQEMYEAEKDKFYAAKQAAGDPEWMKEPQAEPAPKAKRKTKRKRSKPPCPDGDWCP
ncbi:MAG TPA: hypothetical protein VL283_05765 [Candidatus Baltobacteraceae bacterium]|nr:hypothetical protein [Candidatus Baltobacteraceae bacterium]